MKEIDKAAKSMSKQFAFGVESNSETQVNNEDGTMLSVALISVGPALGHGLYVDSKSLETIQSELEGTKLPAYITHRGAIFEDRLTREIGLFENFRIEGDRLLGDFRAFESFREDDNKKFNRLFELAEKLPERFGLSIVFSANAVWATENGDVATDEAPEDALFEYPSIRVEEVSSADFVDSPAANQRGLFSIIDTKPNYKMTKAELTELSEKLKEENESLALSVTESEARVEELEFKLNNSSAALVEDEEEVVEDEVVEDEEDEEGEEGEEGEEVVEDEVVEDEVVEDEEVVEEAAEEEEEEMRESKTLPDARPMEEQIGELEKDVASKLEEIEELKAKLEENEKEMSEEKEKMKTEASKLSSKVATLEKLIEGSDLIQTSVGDEVYEPSKANRAKVISDFAKDNNISEFSATLRLGKDRPELFKL